MLTSQHAANSAKHLTVAQQSLHLEPLTNRITDVEKQRLVYNLLLTKCRVEGIEQDRIFHFQKRNKIALSTEFEVNEKKLETQKSLTTHIFSFELSFLFTSKLFI